MAFLPQRLSGLVLEHDPFGNHLHTQKRVVDEDLCKRNLYRAADALASKVWNGMEVGEQKCVEMDEKIDVDLPLSKEDYIWLNDHAKMSRHTLQIAKCGDRDCCSPLRSDIFKVLKSRFVPAPYCLKRDEEGAIILSDENSYKVGKNGSDEMMPLSFRLSIYSFPLKIIIVKGKIK